MNLKSPPLSFYWPRAFLFLLTQDWYLRLLFYLSVWDRILKCGPHSSVLSQPLSVGVTCVLYHTWLGCLFYNTFFCNFLNSDHISTHSWNHHFLGPWRLNKWESTVCVLTPIRICLTNGELLHKLVECTQVLEFLLVCTHLRAKENKASIWFITVIKSIVGLQSLSSLKQVMLKNCAL